MVVPPTELDVTAQTQSRVRISSFKLSHHRAANGILLVRTSTDFFHHSSFRNGTSHSPSTEKNSQNRFENVYFKIFSQPQVKLVPVTLLQSTDLTSVLNCINAMTKIESEDQLSHEQTINPVLPPVLIPLNCFFPMLFVTWINSQMHF